VPFTLRTLGGLSLDGAGASVQRKRLLLLAVLAAAGRRGLGRETLLDLLWSDSAEPDARNSLKQAVFAVRRALGEGTVVTEGTMLWVDTAALPNDVDTFTGALTTGDDVAALSWYAGPYLDGVPLSGEDALERWVSERRAELARQATDALRRLADTAAARQDWADAVSWGGRLVTADPLDARAALGYLRALAASGDRARALQHARVYETLVREELGASPNQVIVDFVQRLRRDESYGAPRRDQMAEGPSSTVAPGVVETDSVPGASDALVAHVAADASPSDGGLTSTTVAAHASTSSGLRRPGVAARRWSAAAAAAVVLGLTTYLERHALAPPIAPRRAVTRLRGRGDVTPRLSRANRLAITPFRMDAADSALAHWPIGLAELLASAFEEPLAAPAGASRLPADTSDDDPAVRPWEVVRARAVTEVSEGAAIATARTAGATHLLSGSVVSASDGQVVVHAVLTDVSQARVLAAAAVAGATHDMRGVAARVASELLAREAGEPDARIVTLTRAPPHAVRAFLAGRAAYRSGRFGLAQRYFAVALREAPGFALAAVWLAAVANWTGDREAANDAITAAWSGLATLAPADRAYLLALAGPRHPAPSSMREHLAAWREVVRLAPEQPDGWLGIGEAYFHQGEWLALPNASAAARVAFERTLERDPTYSPARMHLAQLLVEAGDTASAYLHAARLGATDTTGESSRFIRWRLAAGRGDSVRARVLADELAAGSPQAVRWLLQSGIGDGVGIGSAERALAQRERTGPTVEERVELARARHSLQLVRGRSVQAAAAVRALRALDPENLLNARFDVLAALYAGGGDSAAGVAVAELGPAAARARNARVVGAARDTALGAACILAQWRMARGDTSGARASRDALAAPRYGDAATTTGSARACRLLVDAARAPRAGGRAARDTLDALLADGAYTGPVEPYLPLAVARAHLVAGDSLRALAAVRRRAYFGRWPYYLSPELTLDAQLSLALGDTVGGICALRHRAALRDTSGAVLRVDALGSRAQLDAFTRLWETDARRADLLQRAPLRAAACRTALAAP
jgi:DNA-binding SARP family transcriptional activator